MLIINVIIKSVVKVSYLTQMIIHGEFINILSPLNYFRKKLHLRRLAGFWICLWCNKTFLRLSCNQCTSKHVRALVKRTKAYLDSYTPLLNSYLPLFTFKPSILEKLLYLPTCGVLWESGKEMFSRRSYTYHVVKINNITLPRGCKSHVASTFQDIKTAYICSISICFCKHREYLRFPWFL